VAWVEKISHLNDGLVALDFEYLTTALGAIRESQMNNLRILGEL
jgi:hypothetical protein